MACSLAFEAHPFRAQTLLPQRTNFFKAKDFKAAAVADSI